MFENALHLVLWIIAAIVLAGDPSVSDMFGKDSRADCFAER
jgi:hypothetical protein